MWSRVSLQNTKASLGCWFDRYEHLFRFININYNTFFWYLVFLKVNKFVLSVIIFVNEKINLVRCVCELGHFSRVWLFVTLWAVARQAPHPWNSPSKILEWAAMLSPRGSSWPRDRTCVSCIMGRLFFFFFLPINHLFFLTWKNQLLLYYFYQ